MDRWWMACCRNDEIEGEANDLGDQNELLASREAILTK